MTGLVVDLDRRKRTTVLICLVFVLIVPVEALDKHEHAYSNEKHEGGPSKDLGRSKLSSRHADHEPMGKSSRVHSVVQSSKTNTGNSVALNRFLENVLRAQDDFKWIDQAVREANRAKYWEKSPAKRVPPGSAPVHDRSRSKMREKRSYENAIFQRDFDFQNGVPDTGQSSLKNKMTGVLNDVPKDWTKTEDICSLSDWLNSKEPEVEKPRDRWIRDYEVDPKNHLLARGIKDRSKQQHESAPTLESLKESLLQLKKSLSEPDKKVHDTVSNVDTEEDADEEKVRGKKKHEMKENDDDSDSSGLISNLKKRERAALGDLGDKNGRKVWRTKRTEVNNDDGSPKLFHRAGFGASYLEEEALKELHDRERRSEGTVAEKRYLNKGTGENLSVKYAESQQGNPILEGLFPGDPEKDTSSDLQEVKQSSNVQSDSENDQKNQMAENDVSKDSNSVDDKDTSNNLQGDKSIMQSDLKTDQQTQEAGDVGSANPGAVPEELPNSNDPDKKDTSNDSQEEKIASNVQITLKIDQQPHEAKNVGSANPGAVPEELSNSNDSDKKGTSNESQEDKVPSNVQSKNDQQPQEAGNVGSANPGAVPEELSNSNDSNKKDTSNDSQEEKVPSNVQSKNDQQPQEAGNAGSANPRLSSSNDKDTSNDVQEDKSISVVHTDLKNDQKNQVAENGVSDSTAMKKSSRIAEKGENLVGNSLRTFGPASNGLQASPSTEEQEDAGASKTEEAVSAEGGEQAIKVLEPQGRLCEDCERTKGVLGSDENGPGKLSQKSMKREEPGNINIILKSENKDMIQFSDSRGTGNDRPFVVNTLDVRKKLIVGKEPGKPDKTVSTVFNVQVEKSFDDSAETKDHHKRDNVPQITDGASIFGFDKSKPNEDLFKDTFAFMNDKEASKSKESMINADKGDSQIFYDDSPSGKTNMNTDEIPQSKEISRDDTKSQEEQAEEDAKGKLIENNDAPSESSTSPIAVGSSLTSDNFKPYKGSKPKTYHEIMIDPEAMSDLKLNDAFGRRILQYMEYSNDDVENAELNYNDKEEEDNLRAGEAESSVQSQRRQRSASGDKGKAKVNVLIGDKMKKQKTKRESVRKRRDPIKFIAYYDYDDDDVEQQVREAAGEQERVKTNSGLNAIDSNQGLGNHACSSRSSKVQNRDT
ncbi:uncharacterized protein LOC143211190 [Lasioglossum baleicum]|uniref:uncharacterized protein LOC143211190 n=1 Tax=Lasioglossum baleicum TaxID=434251 RepID=UPI003FCE59CD